MLCRFDSIIYMDDKNKQAIYEAAQHWKVPTDKVKPRVKSMMSVSLPSVFTVCVFCLSFLLLSLSLSLSHSLTHSLIYVYVQTHLVLVVQSSPLIKHRSFHLPNTRKMTRHDFQRASSTPVRSTARCTQLCSGSVLRRQRRV
jgi:hypothetical protein